MNWLLTYHRLKDLVQVFEQMLSLQRASPLFSLLNHARPSVSTDVLMMDCDMMDSFILERGYTG